MVKKNIKFDDTEIEEYDFHQHKNSISINDSELIDNKKYVKAEQKIQHKRRLSMFLYTSNVN